MIVDPKQDRSLLIPHTVQPPAAAATPALTDEAITPTLTGEQECQREEIEGIIWANTSSKAPAQAQEIEGKIRRMNQPGGGFKEPFTPNQLQHILTEEQVRAAEKLKKEIFEKGVHPALQTKIDRQCMEYHLTDIGNGERFSARWSEMTKYCHPRKTWLMWDGTRWIDDCKGKINELAKMTARSIYREADLERDDVRRPLLSKWAVSSEGKNRVEDMLIMASTDPAIAILPEDLDHVKKCRNVFNVLNGTLDLADPVTFRPHRREDLITKIAGVTYDPAADCPLWKTHLRLIFGGKAALIDAFQEHAGYYLQAGNPEKIFEIWWGESGNNGKTATQKVICQIMGSYARTTGASTFMQSKRDDADTPRSDLMALRGARLAISPETKKNAPLDVATVKGLTGGDQQSCRDMYQKNEVYDPEYTPILVCNHSPRILDTNDAIWNRIRRWPFNVQIPDEKIIPDFDTRLSEEGSGILNWMIEGFERLLARDGKFSDPPELLESTRAYRADQDTVLKFIDARCTLDATAITAKTILHEKYEEWCDDAGEIPISKKEFYKSFKTRQYSFVQHLNVRSIKGIRMKNSHEEEEWEYKMQNEE